MYTYFRMYLHPHTFISLPPKVTFFDESIRSAGAVRTNKLVKVKVTGVSGKKYVVRIWTAHGLEGGRDFWMHLSIRMYMDARLYNVCMYAYVCVCS